MAAAVQFVGVAVETGSVLYCEWAVDHAALVREARADRQRLKLDVAASYVICAKCRKAVPLNGV